MFGCVSVAMMAYWVAKVNDAVTSSSGEKRLPSLGPPWLALPVTLGFLLLLAQTLPLNSTTAKWLAPYQLELYQQFGGPFQERAFPASTALAQPQEPTISISTDRESTLDYAFLLFLALITLVMTAKLFSSSKMRTLLLRVITINVITISLFGLVQRASHTASQTIYGIRFAENPFGPFINQNNAAGFLLLGMAASLGVLTDLYHGKKRYHTDLHSLLGRQPRKTHRLLINIRMFLAELNARKVATLLAILVIAASIVSTTSRGGFLGLAAGCIWVAVYYSSTRRSLSAFLGFIALIVGISLLVNFIGADEDVKRKIDTFSDTDLLETESRVTHWIENTKSIQQFAPLGSGVGSYLHVHRLNRETPERKVWYFAENQYFQTLVESGFIGLFLLLAAIAILISDWWILTIENNEDASLNCLAILGAFLIPSQIIAATFDFGLFIPANAILMAALCGIIASKAHLIRIAQRKPNNLPRTVWPSLSSNSIKMIVFVSAFGVAWIGTKRTYLAANIEQLVDQPILLASPETIPETTTEKAISKLSQMMEKAPTVEGWNTLGELFIHRYRLAVFAELKASFYNDSSNEGDSFNEGEETNLWKSIQPAHLKDLQVLGQKSLPNTNTDWPTFHNYVVERYLVPAIFCFEQSRKESPLQAEVHLRLGELQGAKSPNAEQIPHFLRATQLAPTNPDFRYSLAYAELKNGNIDNACNAFFEYLEMAPEKLEKTVATLGDHLTLREINSRILPDNASLLEKYARKYLMNESLDPLRKEVLTRAINLLPSGFNESTTRQRLRLQIAAEQWDQAVNTNRELLRKSPNDLELKIRLAKSLASAGKLKEAYEVTKDFPLGNRKAQNVHRRIVNQLNR